MGAVEPGNLAPSVRVGLGASLAWKLNRLRCMSPAEIGHRVARAASMQAEKMGLAGRVVVPSADLGKRATPWLVLDARVNPLPYVEQAERILAGRHDIFALRDADLGSPPDWNRDPKTGTVAPMGFGKQLDYRDPRVVGDCKYLWEPNRHLHLVTLAQAWKLTGEAKYAEAVRVHLESWFKACPHRMGVNWASSLETGLRLMNWSLAWQLLGGLDSALFQGDEGRAFRDRWLESVYQHAEFTCGHFSRHSSANNHLIGEAAGAFLAGVAWPHWERARHWRATAGAILEREAQLQNAPDGVNREQAVSYQQFTFDLLLLPYLAGLANGHSFPKAYAERLEGLCEFLASIMDVHGHLPMFGDSDDAFAFRLDPRPDADRFKSMLATGACLFSRPELAVKAGGLDDRTVWLVPGATLRYPALRTQPATLPIRQAFPNGGYYVLGCDFETPQEVRIVADVGPLGYREIAAHGHADALSFTLSVAGRELLVDPGTYAYHADAEWRAYFRGTSAHNTVRIDGADQSEQGGNFMWLRKAAATASAWMSTEDQDLLEGSHDGYAHLDDAVTHRRRFTFDKRTRTLTVEDSLEMKGEHEVELFFHVDERCEVTPVVGGFALARDGHRSTLRLPEHPGSEAQVLRGSMAPIAGWVSRRFDEKVAAPTVRWRARLKGPAVLRTVIDC
jgi:hypothetical protein